MTNYYVRPTVGNDTNGGTNWATDSWATLKKATDTVTAGANIIVMDSANADTITSTTTYTLAAGVSVISSANGTSYSAGAKVYSTTAGVSVNIAGVGAVFGVTFQIGSGSTASTINIAAADGAEVSMSECTFDFGTNSNTSGSSGVFCGASGTSYYSRSKFENCTFIWGSTGQSVQASAGGSFINCDFSAGSTHPSVLFEFINFGGAVIEINGCDLSDIATVFVATPSEGLCALVTQSKLKASATIFSPSSAGRGDVYVYDCDDGDSHIELAHYNYFGSTTISTSVYASDNIADSNLSWKVEGTANASKATPYLSPWLDVYHTGTSAITPYLEVLRSGSTTSYLESEAWIDVLAKTTASSTKSTRYTNRANPLDTTTDNTDSSKGASDWTGEDASNNWYGKLILNASITPAEVGHIRARVGLAGQYTLYVDPQIRGLA